MEATNPASEAIERSLPNETYQQMKLCDPEVAMQLGSDMTSVVGSSCVDATKLD